MRETPAFGLTREEAIGLGVAVLAHGALIAVLTLSPLGRQVQPPPERMTVSFADTVADQQVSPKPDALPAPDKAPAPGDPDPADQPQQAAAPAPPVEPQPKQALKPASKPAPKAEPQPKPELQSKPEPRPVAKPKPAISKPIAEPEPAPVAKPKIKPKPEEKAKPETDAKPKADAKPHADAKPRHEAKPTRAPASDERATHDAHAKSKPTAPPGAANARAHPRTPSGASRIDQDFLKGIPGVSSPGTDTVSPGAKSGAVPVATLVSAIARQIKPHWSAPQGVDTDKLVTVLAWSMKADGSLDGRPVLVSQTGVTDANRAQAHLHVELAMRAVELAAPFTLPPQAFGQWHHVAAFRFDRKLSQ